MDSYVSCGGSSVNAGAITDAGAPIQSTLQLIQGRTHGHTSLRNQPEPAIFSHQRLDSSPPRADPSPERKSCHSHQHDRQDQGPISDYFQQIDMGAGALGLMQLMPRTGRTIALETGTRITTAQLYDPNVNVRLGMHHLGALLRQHAGRLTHVLSAYNAGEHRLTQWLDFPESNDDELLTERIPFAETRDYVRIVQQNAHIYRLAYQKMATTE